MAMGGSTQITVDVGVRLQVMKDALANLKSQIDKTVKPDSKGFKELSGIITKLAQEMATFQAKAMKGFSSQSEFNQAGKELERMAEMLIRVQNSMGELRFEDLVVPPEAVAQLEAIQRRIEGLEQALDAAKAKAKEDFFGSDPKNAENLKILFSIDPSLATKSWDEIKLRLESAAAKSHLEVETGLGNVAIKQADIDANAERIMQLITGGLNNMNFGDFLDVRGRFKGGGFGSDGRSNFIRMLQSHITVTPAEIAQLERMNTRQISDAFQTMGEGGTVQGLEALSARVRQFADTTQESYTKIAQARASLAESQNEEAQLRGLLQVMQQAEAEGTSLGDAFRTYRDGMVGCEQEASNLREQTTANAQANNTYKTSIEGIKTGLTGLQAQLQNANAEMLRQQSIMNTFNGLKTAVTNFMGFHQVLNLVRNAIRQAASHIKELDSIMNGIAIVTNMTTADLWNQVDVYSNMAEKYGVSIKGAYEVSKIYYQAGYETSEVLTLMDETLKLSKVSGLDYAKSTDYMMTALRGFKMEVSDAATVVDVYSNLAANTAVSQEELAIAMSKTASALEGVGASFQEASAMIATMQAVTRESATNIGTAMKSIASRYGEMKKDPLTMKDSEGEFLSYNKVDEALSSVGISLKDSEGQFRDLTEVILELSDVWDTLESTQQRYIATQFAGNRMQSRFLALVSNGDLLRENIKNAEESEDVGTTQYLKSLDSLESKLNQVQVAYQQFYTSIGVESVWKGALDGIRNFIESLNNLPKLFGNIPLGAIAVLIDGIELIKGILFQGIEGLATFITPAIKKVGSEMSDAAEEEGEKAGTKLVEGVQKGANSKVKDISGTIGDKISKAIINNQESTRAILTQTEEFLPQHFSNLESYAAVDWAGSGNHALFEGYLDELNLVIDKLIEIGRISEETGAKMRNMRPEDAVNALKSLPDIPIKMQGLPEIINNISMASQKLSNAGMAINLIANAIDKSNRSGQVFAGTLMSIAGILKLLSALGNKNPYMAIATGIITLINGISTIIETPAEELERLTKRAEELNNKAAQAKSNYKTIKSAVEEYEELKEKRYESAEAAEAYQTKVDELASQYPELINGINELGDITIAASELDNVLAEARQAAADATLEAIKAEREAAERDLETQEEQQEDTRGRIKQLASSGNFSSTNTVSQLMNDFINDPNRDNSQYYKLVTPSLQLDLLNSQGGAIQGLLKKIGVEGISQYFENEETDELKPDQIEGFKTAVKDFFGETDDIFYSNVIKPYIDTLVDPTKFQGINSQIIELGGMSTETDEEIAAFNTQIQGIINSIDTVGVREAYPEFFEYIEPYLTGEVSLGKTKKRLQGYSSAELMSEFQKRDAKAESELEDLGDSSPLLGKYFEIKEEEYRAGNALLTREDYIANELISDSQDFLDAFNVFKQKDLLNEMIADSDNYTLKDALALVGNENGILRETLTAYWEGLYDNTESALEYMKDNFTFDLTQGNEGLRGFLGEGEGKGSFGEGLNQIYNNIIFGLSDNLTSWSISMVKQASELFDSGDTSGAAALLQGVNNITDFLTNEDSGITAKMRATATKILQSENLFTLEGIDNAITELEEAGFDESSDIITSLEDLKNIVTHNLPLAVQTYLDMVISDLDTISESINKGVSGMKASEAQQALAQINAAKGTSYQLSELTPNNGKYIMSGQILEDWQDTLLEPYEQQREYIEQIFEDFGYEYDSEAKKGKLIGDSKAKEAARSIQDLFAEKELQIGDDVTNYFEDVNEETSNLLSSAGIVSIARNNDGELIYTLEKEIPDEFNNAEEWILSILNTLYGDLESTNEIITSVSSGTTFETNLKNKNYSAAIHDAGKKVDKNLKDVDASILKGLSNGRQSIIKGVMSDNDAYRIIKEIRSSANDLLSASMDSDLDIDTFVQANLQDLQGLKLVDEAGTIINNGFQAAINGYNTNKLSLFNFFSGYLKQSNKQVSDNLISLINEVETPEELEAILQTSEYKKIEGTKEGNKVWAEAQTKLNDSKTALSNAIIAVMDDVNNVTEDTLVNLANALGLEVNEIQKFFTENGQGDYLLTDKAGLLGIIKTQGKELNDAANTAVEKSAEEVAETIGEGAKLLASGTATKSQKSDLRNNLKNYLMASEKYQGVLEQRQQQQQQQIMAKYQQQLNALPKDDYSEDTEVRRAAIIRARNLELENLDVNADDWLEENLDDIMQAFETGGQEALDALESKGILGDLTPELIKEIYESGVNKYQNAAKTLSEGLSKGQMIADETTRGILKQAGYGFNNEGVITSLGNLQEAWNILYSGMKETNEASTAALNSVYAQMIQSNNKAASSAQSMAGGFDISTLESFMTGINKPLENFVDSTGEIISGWKGGVKPSEIIKRTGLDSYEILNWDKYIAAMQAWGIDLTQFPQEYLDMQATFLQSQLDKDPTQIIANAIPNMTKLDYSGMAKLAGALGLTDLNELIAQSTKNLDGTYNVKGAIQNYIAEKGKDVSPAITKALNNYISSTLNSAISELSNFTFGQAVSDETAQLLAESIPRFAAELKTYGQITLDSAAEYNEAVTTIYYQAAQAFEQGAISLSTLNDAYIQLVNRNFIDDSAVSSFLSNADKFDLSSLGTLFDTLGLKVSDFISSTGEVIEGKGIKSLGNGQYAITSWNEFTSQLPGKIDKYAADYIDAYAAWLDGKILNADGEVDQVATNTAFLTTMIDSMDKLTTTQLASIAKQFGLTMNEVLSIVQQNADGTYNAAGLLNTEQIASQIDKSDKAFVRALNAREQAIADDFISAAISFIDAGSDGDFAQQDYADLNNAISDYEDAMLGLGKDVTVGVHYLRASLIRGGTSAVSALQQIAQQAGRELTAEEVETAYRSQVNKFVNAIDTITAQAGAIVDATTASIIDQAGGATVQLADTGQYVVQSAANLYEAYKLLLEELIATGEATLADINKVAGAMLDNRDGEQVIIDALGDAAGMTYTRFGEILAQAGIELTEGMVDQLEAARITKHLGGNKMAIIDFSAFADLMGWEPDSDEYTSAFKTYNDSMIQMNRQTERNILEEVSALGSAKGGDWLNLTQLTSKIGEAYSAILSGKLFNLGGHLEDGILKLDSDANIPAILQTIASYAQQYGGLLQEDMAQLADILDNVLKSYAEAIQNGIKGTLTNSGALDLKNIAGQLGVDLNFDLDFRRTAEGLELSRQKAIELYMALKQVDSVKAELVFDDLFNAMTSDPIGDFRNMAETMATIKETQDKIIANSERIEALRTTGVSGNDPTIQMLRNENSELERQLSLYEQIASKQATNPESYNFMNQKLPDFLQGPKNYWDSIGKAYTAMNQAASNNNKMDLTDYYNIVNEMANLAALSGNLEINGIQFENSAEYAAYAINAGLNALTNVDGKGVQVDLSKIGINFVTGANNMQSNFQEGIKAFADSQIEMLDAAIQMMEVIVAMEKIGDLDLDQSGVIDLGEIGKTFVSEDDGQEYFETFNEQTRAAVDSILDASRENEELRAGLEQWHIGQDSLMDILTAIEKDDTRWLKDHGYTAEMIQDIMNYFKTLSEGDYDITDLQNAQQVLDEIARKGEKILDTLGNTYDIKNDEGKIVKTQVIGVEQTYEIEWEDDTTQKALEAFEGTDEEKREQLKEAFARYARGEGTSLDVITVMEVNGGIEVERDAETKEIKSIKDPKSGKTYSTPEEIAQYTGEQQLLAIGVEPGGVTTIENETTGEIESHAKITVGKTELDVVSIGGDAPKYLWEGTPYDSIEDVKSAMVNKRWAEALAEQGSNPLSQDSLNLKQRIAAQVEYEFVANTTNTIQGNSRQLLNTLKLTPEEIQAEIQQALDDPNNKPGADGKYHVKLSTGATVDGFEGDLTNTDTLSQDVIDAYDPEGIINKVALGISKAFEGDSGNKIGEAIKTGIENAFKTPNSGTTNQTTEVSVGEITIKPTTIRVDATSSTPEAEGAETTEVTIPSVTLKPTEVHVDTTGVTPSEEGQTEEVNIGAVTLNPSSINLSEEVSSNATQLGTTLAGDIASGVQSDTAVSTSVSTLISTAATTISTQVSASNFSGSGQAISQGVANGITMGAASALIAAAHLAEQIKTTFNSRLGINSPSTVMRESGSDVTAGLIEGINSGSEGVSAAMEALAAKVTNAFSPDMISGTVENLNSIDEAVANISDTNFTNLDSLAIGLGTADSKAQEVWHQVQQFANQVFTVDVTTPEQKDTTVNVNTVENKTTNETVNTAENRTLSVDTSGAESSMSNLGSSASEAGGNVSSLAGAIGRISTSSSVAAGYAAGLADAMAKIKSTSIGYVSGLATAMAKIPSGKGSYIDSVARAMSKIPSGVGSRVTALATAMAKIPSGSKTLTQNITLKYTTSKVGASAKGNMNGSAFVRGTKKTLMGELGPELVVSHGHYFIVGENGAEFVDLDADAIVFNHRQTRRLLEQGNIGSRGRPFTNETNALSFARGKIPKEGLSHKETDLTGGSQSTPTTRTIEERIISVSATPSPQNVPPIKLYSYAKGSGPAMASASAALAALKELRAMWKSLRDASAQDLGALAGRPSGGGGGGGCFAAGTLITTNKGYKNIEDIEVGDIVLSYNEQLMKNEYSKVLQTMIHDVEETIYHLFIENEELIVTGIHRFLIAREQNKEWIPASQLEVGDLVLFANGIWHQIHTIKTEFKALRVYNFEVSNNHNYYVGKNQVLAHNKGGNGGCFAAGTPIAMQGYYKAIENIKKGDIVLSYNEKTGNNEYSTVLQTMIHEVDDAIYTLYIEDDALVVTGIHRFFVMRNNKKQWIQASELEIGDLVLFADGTWHEILDIDIQFKATVVYNFEVSNNHNYYVGKNKILAHNKGGGDNDDDTLVVQYGTVVEEIERWYTLLRKIDKLEKDITMQQALRSKYQSDQAANGGKIYNTYRQEMDALKQEIDNQRELAALQEKWYYAKQEELAASNYGKIFKYEDGVQVYTAEKPGSKAGLDILETLTKRDVHGQYAMDTTQQLQYLKDLGFKLNDYLYNDDGTTALHSSLLSQFTTDNKGKTFKLSDDIIKKQLQKEGKDTKNIKDSEIEAKRKEIEEQMMENFWGALNGWKDELDSLYDSYHETYVNIEENLTKQNEILQELVDNEISIEESLYKAIEDREQARIDTLKKEKDMLSDANKTFLDGLSNQLNKEKEQYEKNQNQQNLTKLQRQLAILQRTGGSAAQIKSLQDQIDSQSKDQYFKEQQDQIDAMQEASNKQTERLDKQISIAEDILQYQKDNGLIWKEVRDIMASNDVESMVAKIASWSNDINSNSLLKQSQDIRDIAEKIQIYMEGKNYTYAYDKEFNKLNFNSNKVKKITDKLDKQGTDKTNEAKLLAKNSAQQAYNYARSTGSTEDQAKQAAQLAYENELQNYYYKTEPGKKEKEGLAGAESAKQELNTLYQNWKKVQSYEKSIVGSSQSDKITDIQFKAAYEDILGNVDKLKQYRNKETNKIEVNRIFEDILGAKDISQFKTTKPTWSQTATLSGKTITLKENSNLGKDIGTFTEKKKLKEDTKFKVASLQINEKGEIISALLKKGKNGENYSLSLSTARLKKINTTTKNKTAYDIIKSWSTDAFKKLKNNFKAQFATGGIADFTGPAWLDGTKKKPEAVLNATQTQFLKKNLLGNSKTSLMSIVTALQDTLSNNKNYSNNQSNGLIIENINLTVESDVVANDYDARRLGDIAIQEILKTARKTTGNLISRR